MLVSDIECSGSENECLCLILNALVLIMNACFWYLMFASDIQCSFLIMNGIWPIVNDCVLKMNAHVLILNAPIRKIIALVLKINAPVLNYTAKRCSPGRERSHEPVGNYLVITAPVRHWSNRDCECEEVTQRAPLWVLSQWNKHIMRCKIPNKRVAAFAIIQPEHERNNICQPPVCHFSLKSCTYARSAQRVCMSKTYQTRFCWMVWYIFGYIRAANAF